MRTGLLAVAVFTWILDSESAGRKDRKISTATGFKNRGFVDGNDRDLSRDPGGFCQCSAFPAWCCRSGHS